jgi:hypothetical protein
VEEPKQIYRHGPTRYFVPVCVRWPWGFVGGPSGYEERSEGDLGECPVIVDGRIPEQRG